MVEAWSLGSVADYAASFSWDFDGYVTIPYNGVLGVPPTSSARSEDVSLSPLVVNPVLFGFVSRLVRMPYIFLSENLFVRCFPLVEVLPPSIKAVIQVMGVVSFVTIVSKLNSALDSGGPQRLSRFGC